MTTKALDEERLNGEIRKFLKKVGITSQIEIENAVRAALAAGTLDVGRPMNARVVLEVADLGLRHVVEHELTLS